MQRLRTRMVMTVILTAWLAGSAATVLAAQAASPATAQAQTAQSAGPEQQDQFVPVKTLPQQETLPAATLVMAAYGFVWAVLLVYVWSIWRRLMKVEREMHELSARIGEKGARR